MRDLCHHKSGLISFNVMDEDGDNFAIQLEPLTLSDGYEVTARITLARQPRLGHGKVLRQDDGTYLYEDNRANTPELAVAMGFGDVELEETADA